MIWCEVILRHEVISDTNPFQVDFVSAPHAFKPIIARPIIKLYHNKAQLRNTSQIVTRTTPS